jgi:hypothetical protein
MTISQPEANEQEISLCFKTAIEKLDRVDANAEKEKTQIVKDLAKTLEGKIPTDRIANEIVHQLHGKVSPRTIRNCLDEKYKERHRVANARKQKRKESTEDLAATVPLNSGETNQQEEKKVAIDTMGNEIVEQENPNTKEESMLSHSLDDDIASVSRLKEDLTATKNEVLVSHVPMTFENLRRDMSTVFQSTKGIGNVFFKVCIDLRTRVVEIDFCGITQHEPMISTGKGILKEAETIFPMGT